MLGGGTSVSAWDEAASPRAVEAARRFEADWRASKGRIEPADFVPGSFSDHPGEALAILRAEMDLRWERSDPVRVEEFIKRYPDLSAEVIVGLLYEEFCLREESGHTPDPAEFARRFPEHESALRRVLEVHDLVGHSGQSTATFSTSRGEGPPFPEAGQTIGGFRLVSELGRGAFARVFLAEERQLADRPVALKVARTGSREPQTLARLQHTHIVPVHSYRTDPATGLHLLCMPFFGRTTLGQVLADPQFREARTGDDILTLLERIEPPGGLEPAHRTVAQQALTDRPFASALAWWGARLAEALEHAHDRGVLHRDVKPTNVLVTRDGSPMLLDFNLAHEPIPIDDDDDKFEPSRLGGTVAYMAPEHLEALAAGDSERVDARGDLYSLGVVLYEAISGERPFGIPRSARSLHDAISRAAAERRQGPPPLRRQGRPVSPALEAVVRRCLEADPDARYQSGADLARDLQAVADDDPLVVAREPITSRTVRWARRNRWRFAASIPFVVLGIWAVEQRIEESHLRETVHEQIREGREFVDAGNFLQAIDRFQTAELLASPWKALNPEKSEAHEEFELAKSTHELRQQASQLTLVADRLRFHLLGFLGASSIHKSYEDIERAVRPFSVFENPYWANSERLKVLETRQRDRLPGEVNELLFLWAMATRRSDRAEADVGDEARRMATRLCERALVSLPNDSPLRGPWLALCGLSGDRPARIPAPPDGAPAWRDITDDPDEVLDPAASAAFLWGVLARYQGQPDRMLGWLEYACSLKPDEYWPRFYLAACLYELGQYPNALRHADAAVALRPDSGWAWFHRAEIRRIGGDLPGALSDLDRAAALSPSPDEFDADDLMKRVKVNRGLVLQARGEWARACDAYNELIADGPNEIWGHAALLNRARIDVETGAFDQAEAAYARLLHHNPKDLQARHGLALLETARGRYAEAEAELVRLVRQQPSQAILWLPMRIRGRLRLGELASAHADAVELRRRLGTPEAERLLRRVDLALGRLSAAAVEDPAVLSELQNLGRPIAPDIRRIIQQIDTELARPDGPPQGSPQRLELERSRVVLLGAARDPGAIKAAERLVHLAPGSHGERVTAVRVLRELGRYEEAARLLSEVLSKYPDNPPLLLLRGQINAGLGEVEQGLADLEAAESRGYAPPALILTKARLLMKRGSWRPALASWSQAIALDPTHPDLRLGRAAAHVQLEQWDAALEDLAKAREFGADRPDILARAAGLYALCLPHRPSCWTFMIVCAHRAVDTAWASITHRAE